LIKKFLLLAGMALLANCAIFAQETPKAVSSPGTPAAGAPAPGTPQWSSRDMTYHGLNYDVLDSSYYPKKRLKQFRQYMDHQYAFPPKPRNQWEVGVGLGQYNVVGDIPSLMLWQKGGFGFHAQVRKAWGYVFSTRIQYMYGIGKNLDYTPTASYDAPYTNLGYVPIYDATAAKPADYVYRATRTESSQLNGDAMFNLKNINFHRARNGVSFYAFFGLGALAYKTRVNAEDANGNPYNFGPSGLNISTGASNNTVRKQLQSKMDNTYESVADNGGANTILDKKTLDFAPSVGMGVQFKFNKTWNLQIEERYTFTSDDYIDGTRFGGVIGNSATISQGKDAINYLSVGINYNIKNKKKSVEPLYWINPLDHAYNELSYPRHMLLPNPVLPDEDGDGVTDQFDKCPKTPAGVAVDVHGCPLDTDGDGVPDYKDKQLITPTECQPVDADGVGKCPCPEGCGDKDKTKKVCTHIVDGSLTFPGKSTVTREIQQQLSTLASQMRLDPDCKVVVIGNGEGSKLNEQKAWERVNAAIEYMTEKENILRERFIFQYGHPGDENVVNFRSAEKDETGPSAPPPPHPERR
jgi:OOP family OmpA-OmpF porin